MSWQHTWRGDGPGAQERGPCSFPGVDWAGLSDGWEEEHFRQREWRRRRVPGAFPGLLVAGENRRSSVAGEECGSGRVAEPAQAPGVGRGALGSGVSLLVCLVLPV